MPRKLARVTAVITLTSTLLALSPGCADDTTDSVGETTVASTPPSTDTGGDPSAATTSPTTTGDSDTGPDATDTATTTTTDTTGPATVTDPGTTTDTAGTDTNDSNGSLATGDTDTTGDPPCAQGTLVCDGMTAKVCDGVGGFESEQVCPKACAPGLGCTECVPDTGTCEGQVAQKCKMDGTGFEAELCDDVQGVTCDPNAGECVGACAPKTLGTSYIGCQYYPVVTPNVVIDTFTFAVVVSNVSNEDADVTIERGGAPVADILVPANTVEVIPLPWVPLLKQTGESRTMVDGAYRVRSTQPVTVYQYNPLEYQKANDFSFTNDASLLMPTNVWGTDTIVVARNTLNGLPGLYTVVALEDNTTITLAPSASGKVIVAGGGVAADGTGVINLGEGDVLQVLSGVGGGGPDISDVTGTRVTSDKPVEVLGAHACSYVPFDITACDHLEEFNLPFANLAKEYLVTTPLVKAPNMNPTIKARMVRVIATTDATILTYDPPQPGAPAMLAKAGDYAEVQTDKDFKITANFKIAVSEYMLGQAAGGGAGDPAMTISVPTEQYRSSYSFHAPTNYESSFANITAPAGAAVTIDGQAVAGFAPIGATGFSVARVQLSNAGDGDHTITGAQAFGVQVYGYGQYTSYWYPGGLNLNLIPQ